MLPKLLRALPLLAALTFGGPLLAQIEADVGGGEAPTSNFVSPGLESRTPSAEPISPDDVQLFQPYEDQLVGRVSIPNDSLGVLVQPDGRAWRAFRIQWGFWITTGAILVTVAALAALYLLAGRIRIEHGRSGRWVPRFSGFERLVHWTTATSFVVLALTGLVFVFGRYLLIPILGHARFTPLAELSKDLHNWSSLAFVLGILAMLVLWVRDNIPERADIVWLRQMGGMFSKPGTPHPETGRFNAGQKGIFWIVVLGGLVVALSGYVLMTPLALTGIMGMQIAHAIHLLVAVLMIAVIIAHIYLGSLGMEGAFDAMGRGEVDENWAKEHHSGWYEAQVRGRGGRKPRGRSAAPAE